MYENRHDLYQQELLFTNAFKKYFIAFRIIMLCLAIGVAGYHYTANIAGIDAFHHVSMILSGMGPAVEITLTTENIFRFLCII